MSLDVMDIVTDPDFATQFNIIRVTGNLDPDGTWTSAEQYPSRLVTGIILPAKWDQLQVLPEGERNKETIVVYSPVALGIGDQATQQADIVLYSGVYYRVVFAKYYPQANVWFAIAQRYQRVSQSG